MASGLTLSQARAVMERHGLRPRKGLGQHFLVDQNTVAKIVRLAGLPAAVTVVEVGPGIGSLTMGLAESADRVIAVEIDARVAAALRDVLGDAKNVEVIVADAMAADLRGFVPEGSRLVANLPYNLATPILLRFLREVPAITGGLVMTQREVAQRWTAAPGSKVYGAVTVKRAYWAEARIVADVAPTVFLPPPRVSSCLVSFERRPQPSGVTDAEQFMAFVDAAFAMRRKTIRNALRAAGHDRPEELLAAAGLDSRLRPEQIGLDGFVALFSATVGA